MSYHLEMEKGKKPNVAGFENPPTNNEAPQPKPEEIPNNLTDAAEASVESQELELQLHPELSKELPQEVEESVEEQKPIIRESPNSKNIRLLRERAERAERAELERDQLALKLAQLEQLKQQVNHEKPIEKHNLNDDDYVEAKHLRKYDDEIRRMQEKIDAAERQSQLASVDSRLKAKYPDLDNIVTIDNLKMLRATYPELADTLNSSTDLYNKGVAAYELIKRLGIVNEDVYVQDKEKIMKNAAKPRPVASVSPQHSESPLTRANAFANGLTDELKTQLRKEMEAARRNH